MGEKIFVSENRLFCIVLFSWGEKKNRGIRLIENFFFRSWGDFFFSLVRDIFSFVLEEWFFHRDFFLCREEKKISFMEKIYVFIVLWERKKFCFSFVGNFFFV